MHAIETTATVASDGSLTIEGPVNVPPGRHRVVVVFGEQVSATEYHAPSEGRPDTSSRPLEPWLIAPSPVSRKGTTNSARRSSEVFARYQYLHRVHQRPFYVRA